ncbi:hypothetical protein AC244_33435 [Ensifer adhaerens]|uniref:Tn3 transposase DDE domain-containing protein n=1 Tax=Ensifer adhaerens TaxID=106592 RepID=A0A0L8BD67_ENSAD|nr:hypothetical protein AC244_33435 [Ensifer adhaerens]
MNANASEAIYVLDGLLYHSSDLAIETHYVDTGGVSDMSFALCHRRADQGKLGRHPAPGHDDPLRPGSAFDPAGEAVRIPASERTGAGATRSRTHQSLHLPANTLARALFYNRLGELRDRTFESQFYRAPG